MKNLHTVIVPGVGGSDADHWQTWLEHYLDDSSRVIQQDWHQPILEHWVKRFYQRIRGVQRPVRIVAHSFGCLTAIAALNQYPVLKHWIDSMLLVAPANPARFSQQGFATTQNNLAATFEQFVIDVPTLMVISENDPWLSLQSALHYADLWNIPYINQGQAGHINVASGYGQWTQVLDYLDDLDQQNPVFDHRYLAFAV